MYLKNLTVLGFKSFADKTSLNFQPGVTAIVGPNGCGKSNVSDAIRWVLGEQSAKALRGGEMADVIFNGTDSRKALGLAEVSLTIGDVDQEHLSAAGVEMAYNEVTVTRRVFRDGGSEYFINKTPCRLKDIQQLFMGTGVGRTSYSIMAQGNITQILSSKPEDRRMIFEEAAGITKFKSQKKEALRKLEYTDQNLLRVSDLIREVKRQIGSLQRQAGKARRYKALLSELQHLETQLARHQFDVLQAEIGDRLQSSEKLRLEIELSSESLLRHEDEVLQLRERSSELAQEISQAQQEGLELKGQIERHESRVHFNEERLLELETQHGKALNEISQAEERRRAAEEELSSVTERLATCLSELEQQRSALQTRQEALRNFEEALRNEQESLREAQSDAFGSAQQLSRARNELNALDLQKQGNIVRLEKLSAEKIQLEEERAGLERRLQEFAAEVEAQKITVQTHRGTVEERQSRLREITQELLQVNQGLDGTVRRQAEQKSRLSVLEQLQADHEGFAAGPIAALKQSNAVLGSLADRMRVPDQYVLAIESALGHHLQVVLTENPDSAQTVLSELQANKKGRVSIAPLAFPTASETESSAGSPADETAGENGPSNYTVPAEAENLLTDPTGLNVGTRPIRAISVVEADVSIRPLLERLLGLTRIVPDLAAATEAWRETAGAFHFVTLGGELLSRHGVYTGGTSNGAGQAPGSILGRKNQINDLHQALGQLNETITEQSRNKGLLLSEQTALQATLHEAQTELRAREVAIATHEGEFNALQTSRRILHHKIDTVVYEIQSLAGQEEESGQKRAELALSIDNLETGERQAQERVQTFSAQVEQLRQQREQANAAVSEAKVGAATQEQVAASFRQQQQPLQQRIVELQQLATQRRNEIGGFGQRKSQWEAETEESRRRIIDLQQERGVVNTRVAHLEADQQAQGQAVAEREEGLRQRRQHLAEVQQNRGTLQVELAQKGMAVQNLRERIQQKYQVNLDEVRSECVTITFADEGPARSETLSPEEMLAHGATPNWEAVSEQVTTLQRKLEEMGPVNLVAIEEYEETEQRHQFLTTQHDDLVKAKEQLMEVLNRINEQTRQMFTETFERIRDNFRGMFSEIFGGGKADLILVNEGDVLDSGIDIVARPPGKQLQNISLLSGGEQTMTAVALLFSIYQVKPSPFCVLDELDAPLDEANINRFIRVLQRFLAHSQFLIITHNKRTIGMADVLYGVTMQEHGVSKIVSVKFHKAAEKQTEQTTPLEPPAPGPQIAEQEDHLQSREDTLEVAMGK